MSDYYQSQDLLLSKTLLQLAPKEGEAFLHFKDTAERADEIIPEKYRELISIAVALSTGCPYCIEVHTRNAAKAGATREEIAETAFISAALKAGAAVGQGLLALRLFDQASESENSKATKV